MPERRSNAVSTIAISICKTPLERWIAGRIAVHELSLTRAVIAEYQLNAFRETVAWARQHSWFYARHLASLPNSLPRSLDEVSNLPFTNSTDLSQHGHGFLCVSQDEISRVVTLNTSGTSGAPKRIFLTAADRELALDFFANGVATLALPGDRMLIALPSEREGGVGDQLAKGISRSGIIPIPHGLSTEPGDTLARMEHEKVTCIIGLPVQILALALHGSALASRVFRRLRSIVLCSDHVPESIVRRLRQRSDAEIFEHYGMTEMGLGGGVDCEAHMGYHLREADLYFEIVDPFSGQPLPDGETGEIVFTTLHHAGMPLIRYRTGDLSRFLRGPCGCGTILKRLESVRDRIDGFIPLGKSGCVSIAMLDEALFAVPGLLDFTATVYERTPRRMELAVYAPGICSSWLGEAVRGALKTELAIRESFASGELEIAVTHTCKPFLAPGIKRKIEVRA
jgi:phenylacetate-coenzyme A ligase PaaK-like adenylate-forming protein